MQTETALRFHLTPVRMATIKKMRNNKFGPKCGEKEHLCTADGNVNCVAIMKNNMEVPQKLK